MASLEKNSTLIKAVKRLCDSEKDEEEATTPAHAPQLRKLFSFNSKPTKTKHYHVVVHAVFDTVETMFPGTVSHTLLLSFLTPTVLAISAWNPNGFPNVSSGPDLTSYAALTNQGGLGGWKEKRWCQMCVDHSAHLGSFTTNLAYTYMGGWGSVDNGYTGKEQDSSLMETTPHDAIGVLLKWISPTVTLVGFSLFSVATNKAASQCTVAHT
ncbi:hypothetical protein Pmani_025133 [Petrolisthes manimaculis]|uniref:Uncharacterized protein n=1 Tax=Petrolisthes manimaculis TaxID=1843537 RepID=A0AAE1P8C7_9EUCA|nr:hypothetical protein Pmani_025133 [Petrolisthes manimaculis]